MTNLTVLLVVAFLGGLTAQRRKEAAHGKNV
jgi:hypothetical protein